MQMSPWNRSKCQSIAPVEGRGLQGGMNESAFVAQTSTFLSEATFRFLLRRPRAIVATIPRRTSPAGTARFRNRFRGFGFSRQAKKRKKQSEGKSAFSKVEGTRQQSQRTAASCAYAR